MKKVHSLESAASASFIEICTLDFDIFFYKNGNYSLIKKNRGKEY